MGCGASSAPVATQVPAATDVQDPELPTSARTTLPPPGKLPSLQKSLNRYAAFAIDFDDGKKPRVCTKQFLRLAPIQNAPQLTAACLAEKQLLAERKRNEKLETIKNTSRKMSRLKRNIADAKSYEKTQTQQTTEKIEAKQKSASKTRENKLREIQQKKEMRNEHAERIKATVQRLRQADEDVDFEVEKDENFNGNDDDVDSWLDGDNNEGTKDRSQINGGRSESRIISAGTIDGFEFDYKHESSRQNIFDADDFYG